VVWPTTTCTLDFDATVPATMGRSSYVAIVLRR
jgi:hypothetical protein